MPKSDQSIDVERYQTIPRALIFLFDQNNHVLLLKGSPNKTIWAGLYNGIGGHIEAGEDILEAAERELKEESGLAGIKLSFCGQVMVDVSENIGVAIFIFRGNYSGDDFNSSDEGRLAWVDLEEMLDLTMVEDLRLLIPMVANHQDGDPMIIGKYSYDMDGKLIISFR